MGQVAIAPVQERQFAGHIWPILQSTIRAGDAYALPRDMPVEAARAYWFAPGNHVFTASENGVVIGSYFIRANAQGGGAHVANAGFVTGPRWRGRGVARVMGEHALVAAKDLGFQAMQFNFVVAANRSAVRLWRSLGFEIVGTLPNAFALPSGEFSDVFVMYRVL